MVDIIVTKSNRGEVAERPLDYNPTLQNSKTAGQIAQMLEFAKTETSPRTFGVCLNFKDLVPYRYKCPEDLVLTEIVPQIETDTVTITRSDLTPYELVSFLSQFEEIIITPESIGMVILIGEFKL